MFLKSFFLDAMGAAPVFMREFRSRMRRPWAFWLLLGYPVLLIPPGLYFLYHFCSRVALTATPETLRQAHQGGVIFGLALFGLQFLLITLLTPALASGSFTVERAKQSLVFTLLTPLPSRQIVEGKLYAVLFFVLLLILSTMPLCAIASLFGGLSLLDILSGYVLLLTYARLVGAFGLYVSSQQRVAGWAPLVSYLGALAVPICFPFFLLPLAGIYTLIVQDDPTIFLQISQQTPIPLCALLLSGVCWWTARWLIDETIGVLDYERRMWGTYAPPLPLHRLGARQEMPAPVPQEAPPADPPHRRW